MNNNHNLNFKNGRKRYFKQVIVPLFLNKCVKCEGKSGLINVELDHIKPTYKGGVDEIWNYQPLCARCNSSKGRDETDYRISFSKKYGILIPKELMK